MSPIHENELRAELWYATPDASDAHDERDLAATAIQRGRGVRRRRAALSGVAALAVLAVSGWGAVELMDRRPTNAVPLAPPSSAAPPAPSPAPTAAAVSTVIPADAGTWPPGFLLPDEDRPATDQTTVYLPTPIEVMCLDGSVELPAVSALERSRIRSLTGPEYYEGMGLLTFASDRDAAAFLDQLTDGVSDCADASEPTDQARARQAAGPVAGLGDAAYGVRQWQESKASGAWEASPGGGVQLFVQEGRHVAFAATGGDSLGDPVEEFAPDGDSRIRTTAEAILKIAP